MYNFYLEGCSKPVWSYKTWHWARKRLTRLANDRSLKSARIEYALLFSGVVVKVGAVVFNQDGYVWCIDWKGVK